MAYKSVDQLQKILSEEVFHYTKDAKKASGRALGTLVEIITFYLLKSWGFENSVAIERSLTEYGNPDITHNVEYSLHPILRKCELYVAGKSSLTPTRLLKTIDHNYYLNQHFYLHLQEMLLSQVTQQIRKKTHLQKFKWIMKQTKFYNYISKKIQIA